MQCTEVMKQDLEEPRQVLLRVMQKVHFGRIEELKVQDGLPVLDPPPDLVMDVKLEGENGPRPEINLTDFALKTQVRKLFSQLDDLQNGTVECIQIKYGLPFLMTIRKTMHV